MPPSVTAYIKRRVDGRTLTATWKTGSSLFSRHLQDLITGRESSSNSSPIKQQVVQGLPTETLFRQQAVCRSLLVNEAEGTVRWKNKRCQATAVRARPPNAISQKLATPRMVSGRSSPTRLLIRRRTETPLSPLLDVICGRGCSDLLSRTRTSHTCASETSLSLPNTFWMATT